MQTILNTIKKHTLIAVIFILTALITPNLNADANDIGWLDSTIRSISTNIEEINNLKITGFIQAQFQSADSDGAETLAGTLPSGTHNTFRIRRGRLKVSYASGITNYVVQFNGTETGLQLLDAFVEVKDPFINMFTLRGGIFKPTMDQELLYGSDSRYCNEAARIIQKLFPTEYDMGFQLAIKYPNFPVSLTAGLLNGTTIAAENDNRKNFTARLLYDDKFLKGKVRLLLGAATYQGGVYQATDTVYSMVDNTFSPNIDINNSGKQGKRNYYVFETTAELNSAIGKTWLNAEYWFGDQTGTATSAGSPSSARPTGASYIRPFGSFFCLLAHEIVSTNTALAVKYDYYDPNTAVSADEIGSLNSHTGIADISYTTLSCGVIFTPKKNLRFSLWYDITNNETTNLVKDKNDNLLTFRMQVRF